MTLTILDLIVIVVVIISATLAMVRGFAREVLSVASWLAAVGAAYFGYKPLLPLVEAYIQGPTIATVVAAAVIFFIALIVASYLTTRVSDFIIDSRVGSVDRALGFVFGAVRGVLLLVIALLFFSWLSPKTPEWVADSRSGPMLRAIGERLQAALPQNLEDKIKAHFHSNDTDTAGADAAPGDAAPATAPQPSEPSYSNSTRQNFDQLIQNSGAGN